MKNLDIIKEVIRGIRGARGPEGQRAREIGGSAGIRILGGN